MTQEIFRFVTVRAPQLVHRQVNAKKKGRLDFDSRHATFVSFDGKPQKGSLYFDLLDIKVKKTIPMAQSSLPTAQMVVNVAALVAAGEAFLSSTSYLLQPQGQTFTLLVERAHARLVELGSELETEDAKQVLKEAGLLDLAGGEAFGTFYVHAWDSLFALTAAGADDGAAVARVLTVIRVLEILKALQEESPDPVALGRLLTAVVLLPGDLFPLAKLPAVPGARKVKPQLAHRPAVATPKALEPGTTPLSAGVLKLGLTGLPVIKPGLTGLPSPVPTPPLGTVVRPLGVADLRIVQQTLLRYQVGEIAHVENVMATETRKRKHRWLQRIEDTETLESERSLERTRDTQTTTREELKHETSAEREEQEKFAAGLRVAGNFGQVTVAADASYARSSGRQEAVRFASNYAKEVVDRAVERVSERVREERVHKRIEEVEERNLHGFVNPGPEHKIGIYRWLEKVYRAQVVNYGKRLMFELTVPEPAAFYRAALTAQRVDGLTVDPPPDISELTVESITPESFRGLVREYRLEGITPPPPSTLVVSKTYEKLNDKSVSDPGSSSDLDSTGGGSSTLIVVAKDDIAVPDGYTATSAEVRIVSLSTPDPGHTRVLVGFLGSQPIAAREPGYTVPLDTLMLSGEGRTVAFSIGTLDYEAIAVSVVMTCTRRPETLTAWQLEVHGAIVQRVREAERAYREQLVAARSRAKVSITGRNPSFNREIEQAELKKQAVHMLSSQSFGSFDAMRPAGGDGIPEMNLAEAIDEGRIVRFFEAAFEWEKMTYEFFTYFWGNKAGWMDSVLIDDADPVFSKFLRAGSAKILLPVRPRYEAAVLYYLYLAAGDVPPGVDVPVPDDVEVVAMLDEVAESEQLEKAPLPEGEPWEVVVPTSLVLLQESAGPPSFER